LQDLENSARSQAKKKINTCTGIFRLESGALDDNRLTWLEPKIQPKTCIILGMVDFKKYVTLISFKPEPTIWSGDADQQTGVIINMDVQDARCSKCL